MIWHHFPPNKLSLSLSFPQGMKSYQAQQLYPMEVAELQKLEPKITGGCTAVLAVIANKQLYVANVGDSRAILIKQRPDGTLYTEQLSVDHSVENEEELTRLEQLGLSRETLKRAGRLGMQENTRSIGDYYIKDGYKDVDTLVWAIITVYQGLIEREEGMQLSIMLVCLAKFKHQAGYTLFSYNCY